MKGYKPKQPVNYEHPYLSMLADYVTYIKLYQVQNDTPPSYIIINPEDEESLLHEMREHKILPPNGSVRGKLQHNGIRIIQTADLPKGFFDVVGN